MRQMNYLTLLTLLFCALPLFAQEEEAVVVAADDAVETGKYYGMNQDYVDFTSDQKKFNDWSIGIYAGMNMLEVGDLTSWRGTPKEIGETNLWSYDLHATVSKQITHAFGLGAQFNWGRTEQQSRRYRAHTKYWMWGLIGDINFSQLLRRVDNKSRFGWSLHGYAGGGTLQYDAFRRDRLNDTGFHQVADAGGKYSFYATGGFGLRYKLNQKFDTELKGMYIFTGDEGFDGSGSHGPIADLESGNEDGLLTLNLGLIYKIGKHQEHLAWADPLADIYPGPTAEELQNMLVVCASGDKDDDGVCDDWDRELDTPAGARVDGAGRALDTDLDGVIDLYDECVTLPGPASNNGCPEGGKAEEMLNLAIANLEFSLDSDVISPNYYPILDQAAKYLKHYSNMTFDVIGHTDTRASKAYNMELSKRRANNVKNYLVEKHGIPASQLNAVGMGEDDLRFPECQPATKCPEWKNHANRRVIFVKK